MLTLASSSRTRQKMLSDAAIPFEAVPARVDEASVREALLAEGHGPRAVADALAELKALRVRRPGLVLGCDQTLDHQGELLGKPASPEAAVAQLMRLRGGSHKLHSAAVLAEDGRPVWRHVGDVTMVMRPASPAYLDDYVARNWDTIRHSAGAYTLEGEGARLFHQVRGDFFSVLGLPLLPLIDYLVTRGEIAA
ncbi:Maf family protein [Jannaschia seohaensis]|uniref:Nucleoside triphosphate pyrophosphatase n=1 Tax=Jannaschia seohaensis TaxID=475081 RepID=A0A2Y9BVW2_9RHOB|nr:nucleoside triphosphate pyrophosphatase [Jannaschia seohaensis]PWJ21754.1 septum formation protein [Jannaschia seohaensis]SSA38032.1 septum formation protein [Jannaschia seohaensis]